MNPDRLYLLKSGFMDAGKGPYFCPGCAQMLGLLEFYPLLKRKLDVRWLHFARPRPELVELLGEANQSCPVLVLGEAPVDPPASLALQTANGHWFVEGADEIATCLAHLHGIGIPH
ncbi:MAG: DUF3088 family protein [Verrucomicrobiales bacterium]|nr:DUF3088 family protein [Verrucomicrobiales bacterium]